VLFCSEISVCLKCRPTDDDGPFEFLENISCKFIKLYLQLKYGLIYFIGMML